MKISIIRSSEIKADDTRVGNKARHLKQCLDWGLQVPEFVVISMNFSNSLLADSEQRTSVANQAIDILQADRYAVRSSAANEDGIKHSQAGQYLTKLNLAETEIAQAIADLLEQAQSKLSSLNQFAIIIQSFIEADLSGVTFTRNPTGSREMIIEYQKGRGDTLVQGESRPERLELYWNQPTTSSVIKPAFIDQMKSLEKTFGAPVDIEWCVKADRLYLLQMRPITTITKKTYHQLLALEDLLPRQPFYYKKSTPHDSAPRPCPITLDLLRALYSQQGPIAKAYKKLGIEYTDTKFITTIGNELYVDQEKDLASLLPAYSYLKGKEYSPKLTHWSKIWTTVKNYAALQQLSTANHQELFEMISQKLQETDSDDSFEDCLSAFKHDYATIFEINVRAGVAQRALEKHYKSAEPLMALIERATPFTEVTELQITPPNHLRGNGLDLTDDHRFKAHQQLSKQPSTDDQLWWQSVSLTDQQLFSQAISWSRLREYGRWLAVKHINLIREKLLSIAKAHQFKKPELIFFASLSDIHRDQLSESDCAKFADQYDLYQEQTFPFQLTSSFVSHHQSTQGVSTGIARGKLITVEMLLSQPTEQPCILYSESLTPDLITYFDQIQGIVSNQGAILSHLSIMAREHHLPVVIGADLTRLGIELNDEVQIDGATGEIKQV